MTLPIRLMLVDDDPLVRAGLAMMLDGTDGIGVVAQVGDGADVPAAVDQHHPDIVLMDLRMPRVDGIRATARLRARPEPPEVVVLTTFDSDDNVLRALRAGASGFLVKDAPPAQIVEAIRRVAAGDPMLSPQVMRRLMDRAVTTSAAVQDARAALDRLSPREREVATDVGRGHSNTEIAAALFMSTATVKAHISRILAKLDLTNRTQVALLVHEADPSD
ncbi:response regulator [Leekyejoonella antrihumi]|uniref:Response regulator transcription factor n=1 Tax=Leekyejoonella antrihumi TaxID=1660198 RepID=A0A563DUL5_9MICO|nr:response regulator transcription factor [Leekyejoonella antrihumi]TWP33948.1 response regulator transcription factor [Leekyejoonella antrihumi]